MIRSIEVTDWKSYKSATLYLDPLTVLIGANSGGKSNILDCLRFLQRVASGKDLKSSILGDGDFPGVRGGIEWVARKPQDEFRIEVAIEDESQFEYVFSIQVRVSTDCDLIEESLIRKNISNQRQVALYKTVPVAVNSPGISARLYNEKSGTIKNFSRTVSILSQLASLEVRKEINDGVMVVAEMLRSIFVLDSVPSSMRGYSLLSSQLKFDASNISGVLAGLDPDNKKRVENSLRDYCAHLPEGEILRVWSETVGRFNADAMLYCEERWSENSSIIVDARGMSDGTLKFLATLVALLTRPEKSLLVVEEVDNGLHPSRADLLLKTLLEVGRQRRIDVLITSHNPALLDALGTEYVPFVVVAHRNRATGESQLALLEDIKSLPKLLARGLVGELSADGLIEKALSAGEG